MQQSPTLVEVRESTLTRCGIAKTGNIQRNIKDLLDEKIRAAHTHLYYNAPWLVTFVTGVVPLMADVTDYAVPDDTVAGKIDSICVRDAENGQLCPLERGIRNGEASGLTSESMPQRFEFIDRIIRIAPKPDTTRYDALVLEYYQVPNDLVNDTDRTVIESEAIKGLAEIYVKEHFGGVDTTRLREDLVRHVNNLRSLGGTGDGFMVGGRRSIRGYTSGRNRFTAQGAEWRPWS